MRQDTKPVPCKKATIIAPRTLLTLIIIISSLALGCLILWLPSVNSFNSNQLADDNSQRFADLGFLDLLLTLFVGTLGKAVDLPRQLIALVCGFGFGFGFVCSQLATGNYCLRPARDKDYSLSSSTRSCMGAKSVSERFCTAYTVCRLIGHENR